jgi:hypothetical protein
VRVGVNSPGEDVFSTDVQHLVTLEILSYHSHQASLYADVGAVGILGGNDSATFENDVHRLAFPLRFRICLSGTDVIRGHLGVSIAHDGIASTLAVRARGARWPIVAARHAVRLRRTEGRRERGERVETVRRPVVDEFPPCCQLDPRVDTRPRRRIVLSLLKPVNRALGTGICP